jgi:hypothetical protein
MIGRGEHKKKVTYIRRHGLVDRSPPNVLFRRGLLDNSLVQGRAASLGSRVGSQGATGCDGSAGLVNESIFVQRGDGGVGNNGNAVVVDVGSLVELLLKVGVFAVRRNTTGVEGSLVNVAVDHFAQICSTSLDVRRRAFDGWVEVRRTGSEDGILHLYYTSGTGQSITPGQWRQA